MTSASPLTCKQTSLRPSAREGLHWLLFAMPLLASPLLSYAQVGSEQEPLRYTEGRSIDPDRHEAGLRYAVGVENLQVFRANRRYPSVGSAPGWTYNHAPDMVWWKGRFFLEYLSNPVDEHVAPGQTLQLSSADGRHWSKPEVLFPPYVPPAGVSCPPGYAGYMMHQRMGYYVAPNGKLLALGFYGHAENPFQAGGIGRVVRELREDGTLGPIYFLRYESHAGWSEETTSFPFYQRSEDGAFKAACEALLADRLKTLQWRDEDDEGDARYQAKPGQTKLEALSSFHRRDGMLVMLWKKSMGALSADEGLHFAPVKLPSLIMSGGKVWGQQTQDGRYTLVYNPINLSQYRFPLIALRSDDGISFDTMSLIQAEVPQRRFSGRWKDFGPNYTRGLSEGMGHPEDQNLWLCYSMNKEDIWVSRVPLPLHQRVQGPVDERFDGLAEEAPIPEWNVYNTQWARSFIAKSEDARHAQVLRLLDEDPCDRTRAIRVFEEASELTVRLQLRNCAQGPGRLWLELCSGDGRRPVRLSLDTAGTWRWEQPRGANLLQSKPKDEQDEASAKEAGLATTATQEQVLGHTRPGAWEDLMITVHLKGPKPCFDLRLGHEVALKGLPLAEPADSVERLSLATGPYTDLPNRSTPNELTEPPPEGADEKSPALSFELAELHIHSEDAQ